MVGETAIDPALESEYSLRRRHPEREAIYAGYAERSAVFRATAPALLDARYGSGPRMLLDVFPAGHGAPILVFFHGGYWRALDKSVFSFIAESFVKAGVAVVMPGYDLVPEVSVRQITQEARSALDWIEKNAGRFGGDASRIVLSGHSAGGHLAAELVLAESESRPGLSGLVGVSGVYDLVPLLATSINADTRLSLLEAQQLSPQRALARAGAPALPLFCLVGAAETDGFRQQSHDFAAAWHALRSPARCLELQEHTHFTVLDAFASDAAVLDATLTILYGAGRVTRNHPT